MYFITFLTLFVSCFSLTYAKPPTLTPRDTRVKIEEILKAHVSHQYLNAEIIARSFENYLEELDPTKTYLILNEIDRWINPSDELLNTTLGQMKKEDFTVYAQIHEAMLKAIERRTRLEQVIEKQELPTNVQALEFKQLKWSVSEEALVDRLLRIKSLQLASAEKLTQSTKDQFVQRLQKRRLNRDQELIGPTGQEKTQLILSNVLKAVSSALDSQTAYFTPAEANQFMIQVQQRLFGIGAQLRDDLDGLSVIRLVEGGPASLSGKIKLMDKIIAVNQEPIVGMDITEAVELIRGQQGTPVSLTIVRKTGEGSDSQEETLEIDITRSEVVLKESRLESSSIPFGEGVIGVFHLFSFYQDNKSSSSQDLTQVIQELGATNDIKGIILDLRNNAGGLLDQAVAVTGLFIDKGVVVSVKDNTGQIKKLRNIEQKKLWNGPLLVLTNKLSASASEIVAQTLQDYGRAIVVGDETTYGKGTFQTFTLESAQYGKVNPKGEYKVTRGRYYTVSGKSPQLVGVKADIVVPGIFSEMEIGEQFSKHPVGTDFIGPNFDDDLSDISAFYRIQLAKVYKFNLQQILSTYTRYTDHLKQNSQQRIMSNKNYQNFLKEIQNKEGISEALEEYGNNDLQIEETANIMKDLIYMLEREESTLSEAA
ncbi:MAG: S41 family peptidase [Chlamydiae bacterium]|nr:S41 family peptidase [Chlamydiota bacterium]